MLVFTEARNGREPSFHVRAADNESFFRAEARVFDSDDSFSSFKQQQMNMNQRPEKTSGTGKVS